MKRSSLLALLLFFSLLYSCFSSVTYDVLIKNSHVLDGSGDKGFTVDFGINADTMAAMGNILDLYGADLYLVPVIRKI